ncbi:hypothetical protein VP1G_04536 [Cytospora mali]|uniref:Uncharacterized protein n=1 Tax=Cytospora mali TaxID=578113 RepID=A0A194UZS8_CYTMA|nr:hypothetical protein VP1G_04536 [Valsa mali var. pyri (nom. inval.)]
MDSGESTNTGMETHYLPEFGYVPPKNSVDYQTRPLPAVPPRKSMASSLNSQVNKGFKTSFSSPDNRQFEHDWEQDVDDIASMWDNRMGAGQSRGSPKLDVKNNPTMPPDEILSPQPKQSVQKILKLTGKISPVASVTAPDSPSLHNSQQKIKQLTGLDVGSSPLRSIQTFPEDVSPISWSSSMYSQVGLEAAVSEPDMESGDDSYRDSYRDSYQDDGFNEPATALSPPNFGGYSTRPISTAPVSPTSTPAALRVNGFRGRDGREGSGQVESLPRSGNKFQHVQDNSAESWTLSRESSSTDRVITMYHDTASEIARGNDPPPQGTRNSAAAFWPQWRRPPPTVEHHSLMWGSRPEGGLPKSRLNLSPSSPALPPTLADARRKTESLSDRRASSRNCIPPPLEQSREAPRPGRYNLPQRTPYPLLPSSTPENAFDGENGRKRFSVLSRVFGGGNKRDSRNFRISSAPLPREDRIPTGSALVLPNSSRSTEGSDTPWPKPAAAVSGRPAPAGLGIFQRTMDSARQSVGLKSKAEKRREELKETIRVVGPGELGAVAGRVPDR